MARPKHAEESRVVSFRIPESVYTSITKSGMTASEAMRHIVNKFVDDGEELPDDTSVDDAVDKTDVIRAFEEARRALDKAQEMAISHIEELEAGLACLDMLLKTEDK